jgi:hypothetical protein
VELVERVVVRAVASRPSSPSPPQPAAAVQSAATTDARATATTGLHLVRATTTG